MIDNNSTLFDMAPLLAAGFIFIVFLSWGLLAGILMGAFTGDWEALKANWDLAKGMAWLVPCIAAVGWLLGS